MQTLYPSFELMVFCAADTAYCGRLNSQQTDVAAEFMGFEQQMQSSWLARDSERIWRGSYKNKAWKHLVSHTTCTLSELISLHTCIFHVCLIHYLCTGAVKVSLYRGPCVHLRQSTHFYSHIDKTMRPRTVVLQCPFSLHAQVLSNVLSES